MELNSGIVEKSFQTELNSVWNSGIDLIFALEYAFFQLCSSAKQIAVSLARLKTSHVKCTAVLLTSHASYTAFACRVLRCSKWSSFFFFCSCLSPMIVYLGNLFLLNTPLARMLLTPRWVSRKKDEKM